MNFGSHSTRLRRFFHTEIFDFLNYFCFGNSPNKKQFKQIKTVSESKHTWMAYVSLKPISACQCYCALNCLKLHQVQVSEQY